MSLERALLVGRRTPAGARSESSCERTKVRREIVTVWASDGEEAVQRAIDWLRPWTLVRTLRLPHLLGLEGLDPVPQAVDNIE
jgi:hypothetical protein